MAQRIPITVAEGDGIGPEVMAAALRILGESGAPLEFEKIELGERAYLKGHVSGIAPNAWESLRRTRVLLKAPVTTPQGLGFKSLNVTIRKTLGLFANVRPCRAYSPVVRTKHPNMDVVIVRENEEDLYTGIEYRLSDEEYQALKVISLPGSQRIVRYAFEYAKRNGRKKVTCLTKDNVMRLTDGLFHKVFDQISAEYPEIESEHRIVDIGAAKLAEAPEGFDVLVMPNLYGDILSDVAAQIAGSVGMAGAANIGDKCAMFEAIHGSAPRRAGQNLANPSGLLMGAVMMLVHLGLAKEASMIHNAWLRTLEEGVHTYDVFIEGRSHHKVGTKEFADAVVARLGKSPEIFSPVSYFAAGAIDTSAYYERSPHGAKREVVGVDLFVGSKDHPSLLAEKLLEVQLPDLKLTMITNRGVKVWPGGESDSFYTDVFRCRFCVSDPKLERTQTQRVLELMARLEGAGVVFMKAQILATFDGVPGYVRGQQD
jgi:isocitrate dehydrogenase